MMHTAQFHPGPPRPQETADFLAVLLLRTAQGDHQAFAEFYRRTSRRVFGLVRRVLIDPGLSEDVTQEVFIGVWQEAGKYDPSVGSPTGWLMAIAHHKAVDKVRSHQSRTDREARWATANHSIAHDEVLESVTGRSEAQALIRSLTCLSKLQREAIVLAYFGGLTYREVAEKLGSPLPTIKTRIRDGLHHLRTHLEA